jgi:competence protein ComEC
MTLRIRIHDVGHGQAIHAFTPNGKVVVIDLGCSDDFSPLKWLGKQTKTIDSLTITHPPSWLTPQEVRSANQAADEDKVKTYLAISGKYNSPIPAGERVGDPAVTGGVSINEFYSTGCGRNNINNHSMVVVFEYLGIKVVIPGDNEPASWRELLKQPDFVSGAKRPYVLMASHHGRESGYCTDLFDDTSGIGRPRLCVISDGRVQDTDAASRYSYHALGWTVYSRSGNSDTRSCVTTRSDGYIEIEIGKNGNTGNNFIQVTRD